MTEQTTAPNNTPFKGGRPKKPATNQRIAEVSQYPEDLRFFSINEVADILGISRGHLHNLTHKEKKIKAVRLGNRVLYTQAAIKECLEDIKTRSTAA